MTRTGRRMVARMVGLPFSDKVAAGFGCIVALLCCAVFIAGLGAFAARTSADNVKNSHLPLMETALALEGLVSEAIFYVSMFGMSGDMASYSGARIRFASMRETVAALAVQAQNVPGGDAISRDMDVMQELVRQLNQVVEKKRTINETLALQRLQLRRAADSIGEQLLGLQAVTASVPVSGNERSLDEKARLLILNGFALAVEEVTGKVLGAGVSKSVADLAKAETYFTARWKEAQDAVATASLPTSGAPRGGPAAEVDVERHVVEFRSIMQTMLTSLEEAARCNAERADVTSRLTVLIRGISALVRADMASAVTRTNTALRGATATLFACAFLACILAAGAVVAFVRSRPFPASSTP